MPRPSNLHRYDKIDTTPLYYERLSTDDAWGDLVPSEHTGFYMTPAFMGRLIQATLGLPPMKGIISAGAYVEKPGAHGTGEAFDLDGIVWKDGSMWKATEFATVTQQRDYCVIQCHFMQYFGVVLGRHYNAAHKDHLHLDTSRPVAFRHNSYATVTALQAALHYVYDRPVEIDGVWGPKTAEAFRSEIDYGGKYPSDSKYLAFLERTSKVLRRDLIVEMSRAEETLLRALDWYYDQIYDGSGLPFWVGEARDVLADVIVPDTRDARTRSEAVNDAIRRLND